MLATKTNTASAPNHRFTFGCRRRWTTRESRARVTVAHTKDWHSNTRTAAVAAPTAVPTIIDTFFHTGTGVILTCTESATAVYSSTAVVRRGYLPVCVVCPRSRPTQRNTAYLIAIMFIRRVTLRCGFFLPWRIVPIDLSQSARAEQLPCGRG